MTTKLERNAIVRQKKCQITCFECLSLFLPKNQFISFLLPHEANLGDF